MPALTGAQYIERLKEHPPNVWIDGERVNDVVSHPAFRNNIRTMASLYDMQYDPALHDEMTYCSPTSGEPVGLSFIAAYEYGRTGSPRAHDVPLGPGHRGHDGAQPRLHERYCGRLRVCPGVLWSA